MLGTDLNLQTTHTLEYVIYQHMLEVNNCVRDFLFTSLLGGFTEIPLFLFQHIL